MRKLLPAKTFTKTHYNLRNKHNLTQVKTNNTLYQNSYFPKFSKLWNSLDNNTKYAGNLHEFKKVLRAKDKKPPKYYNTGDRQSQTAYARLRMQCSGLNGHLYIMKVIQDPKCHCGHETEDSHHYLFECPLFNENRRIFNTLDMRIKRDAVTFLYGDPDLPVKLNTVLFSAVTEYIRTTKRFSNPL